MSYGAAMGRQERTPAGEAATELILSTFRANGLLLEAGDLLSSDEGLTSSRWQVLGAIVLAERPLTVPQIARRMGLTRQSVHATVDRLVRDGLLELAPNEDHRRSALVRLTRRGVTTYQAIDARQAAWVNRLARGIARSEIDTAVRVLGEISRRLEDDRRDEPNTALGPPAGSRTESPVEDGQS
jgi:DNA-binding MarR family transcriptional regulator